MFRKFLAAVLSSVAILIAIAGAGSAVYAVEPDEMLTDPALEARARNLSAGLRCLVCQNQSIDDSNAPLAKDLRVLVRERLTAGDSDKAVLDFIVERYGQYVLLSPPFHAGTWLLWLGPLLMLLGGAYLMRTLFRQREAASPPVELSAEERRRLDRLTKDQGA